ncbi:hypothetical protein RHMOL_Rhmol08G0171100 [Rhododendron molle]|uniref:Uncharacterized protein n=1 Tax=Rhododendron molle TaxID=49168 RepID=A0ACC0MPA2_RHOML|nr:hypothetical protein RHMOL_Rhmol08G0171100 [Rhododendron molle]
MTKQLVANPYFPYAFPYIHGYYQEHGAFPLPKAEEDGGEEAAPVLVQIAPLNDVEFVVEGVEEDPECGQHALEFPDSKTQEPIIEGARAQKQASARNTESPLGFEGSTPKEPYFEAPAALFDLKK